MARASASAGELSRLRSVPLLSGCTDHELSDLAALVDEASVGAGAVLVQQGDQGREAFLIVEGWGSVRIDGVPVATVGPGEFVGEIAMLDPGPRTATVVATTPMHLLVIGPQTFEAFSSHPVVAARLASSLADRVRAELGWQRDSSPPPATHDLPRLGVLAEATASELAAVRSRGTVRELPVGTVLVQEGDIDRCCYLIERGAARVTNDTGAIGWVADGDIVGDVAYLHGGARTASVTTVTPMRVRRFAEDEATALFAEAPRLAGAVAAAARLRKSAPPDEPGPPPILPLPIRRGRRLGRGLLATVAGVGVVLVAVAGYYVINRNRTTAVSLEKALEDLRSGSVAPVDVDVPAIPPPAGMDSAPTAAGGPVPAAAVSPDAGPVAGPGTGPAGGGGAVSFARPAAGVYAYRTSGGESISVLGSNHKYPDTTYSTIRHGDGCVYQVDHPIIEEHVDHFIRCSQPGAMHLLATWSEIEFFGQADSVRYDCKPAALFVRSEPRPGETYASVCTGDGARMSNRITVLPDEPIDVGGVRVLARRIHLDSTLSGKAEGTAAADWWFHPDTALPLRLKRTVDTMAHAAFGDVQYKEDCDLLLASLTPRT